MAGRSYILLKVVRNPRGLPRSFKRHPAGVGIVAECGIKLRRHSRLQAKLIIFETPRALRAFWRDALGHHLGRCLGAVNCLGRERYQVIDGARQPGILCVDPRYFCIIGLTRANLGMEIICHESVHAAYAYTKRRAGDYWIDAKEMDEEAVCYPAGRIAAAINRFLHANKLYN